MIDQLPYTLTEGVTATREGLVIRKWQERTWRDMGFSGARIECLERDDIGCIDTAIIMSWPDAAERLQYRDGEPYCESFISFGRAGNLICCPSGEGAASAGIQLHRVATILCDDAEGFKILHWCITEFGDE